MANVTMRVNNKRIQTEPNRTSHLHTIDCELERKILAKPLNMFVFLSYPCCLTNRRCRGKIRNFSKFLERFLQIKYYKLE